VKDEIVAPIWAKLETDALEGIFGGGERGRKLAEVVTAVKYDLPQPEGWEEWKRKKQASLAKQAKSQPRSPTQSKPVQPDSASSKSTDTAGKEAEQG
jgi:hypothetical protein